MNGYFLLIVLIYIYEIGFGVLSVDDKYSLYVGLFGWIDEYRYFIDVLLEKGWRLFYYGS